MKALGKLCLNEKCKSGTITYNMGNLLLLVLKPFASVIPNVYLKDIYGTEITTNTVYVEGVELGLQVILLEDIIEEAPDLVTVGDYDQKTKLVLNATGASVDVTANATVVTWSGSTTSDRNITVRSALIAVKVKVGDSTHTVVVDNFQFASSEEGGYLFKQGDPVAMSYSLILS